MSVAQDISVGPGDTSGAIVQTAFIDDFRMTGGTVQSLAQGDARDTFRMTAGQIIGAFEDGDEAYFLGGSIGRVDMKLDNNLFDMSGGTIVGNLVTGFGNDTILLKGGTIGGNISTSGGVDKFEISGGELKGNLLASFGKDVLTWQGGGIIRGTIDMGGDDDLATLRDLNPSLLTTVVNGGTGQDTLSFDNSQPVGGARYVNWETVNLNNASRFTLNDALVLGDTGTPSASTSLNIDANSSLISTTGSIRPFTAGQPLTVTNSGLIDLSSGNDAQGRLTINGNYTGNNGTLKLNSVLAGDGAASDRLVVNGGAITGTTNLQISNFGGAGASTTQNGIQVVEAANGATSSPGAFVQTQTLSAGAFDYRLYKGGVTPDSVNSWYLRSSVVAAAPQPQPAPDPGNPTPVEPVVVPLPTPAPTLGLPAVPAPVAGVSIPLYRPEVAVYAAAPRAAALIARSALGTFHQRQGDQDLLKQTGALSASWGQAYGNSFHQSWSGTVDPSLDGNLYGFKVGQDLFAWLGDNGYRQHVGLYVGHSRLNGDVKGFALGIEDSSVGDLKLDSDSVGAYWTLVGPQHWYVDAVVQYANLDGRAKSDRGDKLDLDGHAVTASLETGYPFELSAHWVLEPQAQIIAQQVSLDSANDSVSHVSYDAQTEWTGRLGLRLQGNFKSASVPLQPYLQVNVWHGDGGRDTVTFDDLDQVKTDYRYTSMDIGTGLVAQLSQNLSVHAGIDYASNLDARQQERVGANLGVRLSY
ncbi:autotransporter family protein [Pseudomonas tructae]|nr:autotransporter outer membrane beta-barrel domain-containing protein [Pseudomonas tructae]